jgi:hypothetical protein
MRANLFAAVVFLSLPPLAAAAQQAATDIYTPPATLEHLMQDDPTFNGLSFYALAADPPKLRATVRQQAASGNFVAEMLLGESYIPPECTFLPYKSAPADCPDELPPINLMNAKPSFDTAIHWLTLASAQGSGEASEIIAQLMDRMIKTQIASSYQPADVAHFHALARSQGYDLQDVHYSCYTLDPSQPKDRLVMAKTTQEFQFTTEELSTMHAAGASGTIRWHMSFQSIPNGLLRQPEGPEVHTRVVLTHPTSHQILLPLGDRVDVTYLQQGDLVLTLPSAYPTLNRKLAFQSATTDQPASAAFQAIDGTFSEGCDYVPSP